jgi:thiopeptide-type bacteriocin biosynthesis protein
MTLKVLDIVICRTPVFSVNDNMEEKWQELKTLISEASPSFYQAIENIDFPSIKTANKKIGFSIWKYFNRARYRATPFGGFAAFTPIPLSRGDSSPVILNQSVFAKHFIDWGEKDKYFDDFSKVVKSASWFQTNSTIYSVSDEIRFIRFKNECFEMASVTEFPELTGILKLCKEKTNKQEVYGYMQSTYQLNVKDLDILLEQLLTLQLLLTEQLPNITGEDYFQRLNIEPETSNKVYAISERKLISGSFNSRKVKDISDLVRLLHLNLPIPASSQLSDFRNAFLKKYEQAAVPLAIAMDPETGIGYGNLGQHLNDQELIDILGAVNENDRQGVQISYTKLHSFLLNALMKNKDIRLEEFEDTKIENSFPLPNSFSVMLHFYGDQPVIESLGGCTANALIGRFTIASQELEKLGQQISSVEEKANPEILFFDIAYQAEKQVDNVNRRKQLYKHELPILTWSSDLSPINFDDILVGVRNSEVILWSKKYGKRLVPRIPSAYNYTRSDLAVYRFLCDLQHQGIRSDLNFKIRQFFPNLDHYPRVVFKDVIVSPAMWLIPANIMKLNESDEALKALTTLRNWLQKSGINFHFKAGFSDQMLCFDPKIDVDMTAFLLFCRQNLKRDIYISEALLSNDLAIKDEQGKPYVAEYIINYGHEDTVYSGGQNLTNCKKPDLQENKILPPGSDWLYFEIYCHPSRRNAVLLNQVASFLKEVRQKIKKWFFIRYDDPKPHLRLRIQLKEISQGYFFVNRLNSFLEQDFLSGLISDIQIRTYIREVERYGSKRINLVEEFFCTDSRTILYLLEKKYSIVQLYAITLTFMQRLLESCFKEIDAQILFVTNMADSFKKELSMNQDSFKKLNQSFQKYKEALGVKIVPGLGKLHGRYEIEFVEIMDQCHNNTDKISMTADLLHMHINRLFISDQRIHEAIMYHYLLKVLKARRGISTVSKEYSTEP